MPFIETSPKVGDDVVRATGEEVVSDFGIDDVPSTISDQELEDQAMLIAEQKLEDRAILISDFYFLYHEVLNNPVPDLISNFIHRSKEIREKLSVMGADVVELQTTTEYIAENIFCGGCSKQYLDGTEGEHVERFGLTRSDVYSPIPLSPQGTEQISAVFWTVGREGDYNIWYRKLRNIPTTPQGWVDMRSKWAVDGYEVGDDGSIIHERLDDRICGHFGKSTATLVNSFIVEEVKLNPKLGSLLSEYGVYFG